MTQCFSAVTGACLFTRRDVFEAVSGFDESLPVAYNDVDFCLKVRALGQRVICDGDMKLIHKESHSRGHDLIGEKLSRLNRDAEVIRRKWGSQLEKDPFFSPNFDAETGQFSLAFPPAVKYPFRVEGHVIAAP